MKAILKKISLIYHPKLKETSNRYSMLMLLLLVPKKMTSLQISSILPSLQWSSPASWIMIAGFQHYTKMTVYSRIIISRYSINGQKRTFKMLLHSSLWTKASSRAVQYTVISSQWDTLPTFLISHHFCQQTIKHMKNHHQTRKYLVWWSHYQQWIITLLLRAVFKMSSR